MVRSNALFKHILFSFFLKVISSLLNKLKSISSRIVCTQFCWKWYNLFPNNENICKVYDNNDDIQPIKFDQKPLAQGFWKKTTKMNTYSLNHLFSMLYALSLPYRCKLIFPYTTKNWQGKVIDLKKLKMPSY